jgi:hypothetical protein
VVHNRSGAPRGRAIEISFAVQRFTPLRLHRVEQLADQARGVVGNQDRYSSCITAVAHERRIGNPRQYHTVQRDRAVRNRRAEC